MGLPQIHQVGQQMPLRVTKARLLFRPMALHATQMTPPNIAGLAISVISARALRNSLLVDVCHQLCCFRIEIGGLGHYVSFITKIFAGPMYK